MNKIHLRLTLIFLLMSFFQFSIKAQVDELDDNGKTHELRASGVAEDFIVPLLPSYNVITFTIVGGDGGSAKAGVCKSLGGDGATTTLSIPIGNDPGEIAPGDYVRFIAGKGGVGGEISHGTSAQSGAGGGGSAVLISQNQIDWEILAVAGGGGGAYQGNLFGECIDSQNGQGGRATTSGGGGAGSNRGNGGTDGNGGDGGGTNGTGDLSGGGGGAFSNGGGNFSKEGKAGFPNGGGGGTLPDELIVIGHPGGWGFGGGGASEDAPGGGGGYSGGGGGGELNNGGGGGSYINYLYAINPNITEGGSSSSGTNGFIQYRFENICTVDITGFTYVEPLCSTGDRATIQLNYTVKGWSECADDLDFRLNSSFGSTHLGDGLFTGVTEGPQLLFVINTSLNAVVETFVFTTEASDPPPTAICQDVTIQLTNNQYDTSNLQDLIDDGSFDACGSVEMDALVQSNFDCTDLGDHVVTLLVVDEEGDDSSCEATVTVEASNEPPIARCVSDFTVELTSIEASIPFIGNGSTSEGCALTSAGRMDITTLSCEDLGENVITLTVTDQSGLTGSCTTTVTLVDVVIPKVFCKSSDQLPPVVLDQQGTASIDYSYVYSNDFENCSVETFVVTPSSFDCNDLGQVEVTLTATDNSGNTDECTTTITVMDDSPPTAQCKDLTVQLNANGYALISIADIDNGSDDACGISLMALDKTDGFDCSNVGTNTVTLTMRDFSGNSQSCQATVTVLPQAIAICQDLTVQLDANGNASITVADIDNGSSDPCGNTSFELSKTSFSCADIGDNTVTLTATNQNGTTNSCQATVQVQDNTPPILFCLEGEVNLNADGVVDIDPYDIEFDLWDACGIASVVLDRTRFTCAQTDDNRVTLTATDNNGNKSSCEGTIIINDNLAPTARCQDISIQLEANGTATLDPQQVDNGSTDNCGILQMWALPYQFDCNDIGEHTVTLQVEDEYENVSSCEATVQVMDQTGPTLDCAPFEVALDINGNAEISTTDLLDRAFDACGIANIEISEAIFSCLNLEDLDDPLVTLTATDNDGNTSNCQITVYVLENIKPTAICQNATIQLDANGAATLSVEQINNGSYDNCSLQDLVLDQTQFDCSKIGENTVILSVEDSQGHNSSCQAIVTVEDITAPVAICNDLTVQLDENGLIGITTEMVGAGSYDNCSVIQLSSGTLTKTLFSCEDIGTNTVTLTINDESGNTSTCDATISVVDDIAPEVTAALHFQGCNGESDQYVVDCISSDNCSSNPTSRAFIALPNLNNPTIRFRKKSKKNLQFLLNKNQITISAPGNGGAQSWWSQILVDGGILVQQAQQIDLTGEAGSNSITYQFSSSGALQKVVNTGLLTLTCIAVDPSGNQSTDRITVDQICNDDGFGHGYVEAEASNSESNEARDETRPLPNNGTVGKASLSPGIQKPQGRFEVFPNPFNSETTIRFDLSERGKVSLFVFDLQGRLVNQLQQEVLEPGQYQQQWDATDTNGASMPAGVYFIQLRTGQQVMNKKVTLMRF